MDGNRVGVLPPINIIMTAFQGIFSSDSDSLGIEIDRF